MPKSKTPAIALGLCVAGLMTLTACGKPAPKAPPGPPPKYAGSYAKTCRNITTLADGFISAECRDGLGRFHANTIKAADCKGDIGNQEGVIVCNGATAAPAQGGAAAPSGPAVSTAAAH